MKKLLILLVLTLAAIVVMLVERHWFDSASVEPEILGRGYIHQQDNGVYIVAIGDKTYNVSEFYTQKNDNSEVVVIEPADGALVTVVKFHNLKAATGKDVKFFMGTWNKEQIEEAFASNYVLFGIIISMLVFVAVFLWIAYAELVKAYGHRKVVYA